jgi:hypothetical protein
MENISKYLEDKRFINWVFNSNDELDKWWKSFEIKHPKEKQNILLAKNVLSKFKTTDKELSEEEKIQLFTNVLKDIEEKQKSGKYIHLLTTVLKYAAVAILFFSIGALLFYRQNKIDPQYLSQNITEPINNNVAKLIRPNGESILLDNQRSVIEYTAKGKVKINNTTLDTLQSIGNSTSVLNKLIIPYGKTSEILLPDGTKVYLNAGSRFIYPENFIDKNREVFLIGEAFFEVKHDSEYPFIVQTPDINIKVLGTKFNVSAYPSDNIVETVLTEGKVRLKQNNTWLFSESVDLAPNQLATYNKKSMKTELSTVDTDNYTLWKDRIFKFESTELSKVIKKIERFYNIKVQYSNSLQRSIKISGKLDLKEGQEETINRIAVTASVKIIKKGDLLYQIN